MIRWKIPRGWAVALALAVGACSDSPGPPGSTPPLDIVGVWSAVLEHGGSSSSFALELERTDEGGLTAFFSLPDMDVFKIPVGAARLEGDQLTIGSMTLTYDPVEQQLSGTMPASLVPVHTIPLALRRVSSLEPPAMTMAPVPVGDPLWIFDAGAAVWAGIGAHEGSVFVGNDGGIVHALEADTGQSSWRFATGGPIRARPVVMNDSVLVHSDDGRLYRLDIRTGEPRWTATLEERPAPRPTIGEENFRYDHYASAPVVADGTIFIGHADRLHALDAETGITRWMFDAGDLVTSSPAVGGGRVFFGSFDGRIHAVSTRTGESLWVHDTGAAVPGSPALHGDLVIVGSRSYDLLALSVEEGSVVWTFYYWFSWVDSSATISRGIAYIGSSDAQRLNAIEASTGERLWEYDTGGWSWAQPAVSDRSVFIGTVGTADYFMKHRGAFHAVDRDTGRPLWRVDVEGPPGSPGEAPIWGFASSPAIMDGRVFVGGLDGRVYAFPEVPGTP